MAISIFSYKFVNKLTSLNSIYRIDHIWLRGLWEQKKMYYSFLSLKMINFLPWVARVAQW